jgi:phosphoserine phosphatase RsbU/P
LGNIEYINADHNPVYVCTANKRIRELQANGLPLGIFPGIEYTSKKFKLKHGEKIFLYTDGVTET